MSWRSGSDLFSTGSPKPELDDLYATAVSSVITGLATRWLSNPERFTLEEVCNVYRSVVSNGIRFSTLQ